MSRYGELLEKEVCSICGSGPVKTKLSKGKYRIRCKSCKYTTKYFCTESRAINAWMAGEIKPYEVHTT